MTGSKKKKIVFVLTLISALVTAALSVINSSCTSSKGLTLKADSIKTLNVHYQDSTNFNNPFK